MVAFDGQRAAVHLRLSGVLAPLAQLEPQAVSVRVQDSMRALGCKAEVKVLVV